MPTGETRPRPIRVPSQWTHGECFGYPKAWEVLARAAYERSVAMPVFEPSRRCLFRFEAVMLACEVLLNDIPIGGHRGGFTPFECPVSEELWRVVAGTQVKLRVVVDSAAAAFDGPRVLHQIGYPDGGEEGPIPGGIWQNVWLITRPKTYIASWHCVYRHEQRSATFTVEVVNESDADFAGQLALGISGKVAHNSIPLRVAAGQTMDVEVALALPARLAEWSTHDPKLYPLTISLPGVHEVRDRVGFRSVAIDGSQLLINGVPTRLFGLSLIRHRVAPYLWRRDYLTLYFQTLRKLGVNALRLHAAIAPPIMLRVADELGLMLINQSAIWSTVVAGYTRGGREFIENTKREFTEWVRRDRNHPSVVIWDVENEQIRIDKSSLPWVNELIAHMRSLTHLPVEASAAGMLGGADIIHVHCEPNINRMLRGKSFDKPFVAGEWWGPNLEYRNVLHAPLKIPDPQSNDHLLSSFRDFYRREILAQRKHGAAGTFPFAAEVLMFRPLFKKGERIALPACGPEQPYFRQAEQFCKDHNYHVVRRPLVNPGWEKTKPRCQLTPVADAFKTGFAPVVILPKEDNVDFYSGGELARTFVICNDTGKTLRGRLRATLVVGTRRIRGRIAGSSVRVPTGHNHERTVRFNVPKVSKTRPGRLIVALGRHTSRTKVYLWPPRSRAAWADPITVIGADDRLRAALTTLGCRFAESDRLPAEAGVVLVQSLPRTMSRTDVELFLEAGGRLIVLRQQSCPGILPLGFKFKPARGAIREELGGIITSEREINFTDHVWLLAREHPVAHGLPAGEIRPFAAGDHRVLDDAYLRAMDSDVDVVGDHTVIASGMNRSQVGLAEARAGRGVMLLCQLHLAENLGLDPQADTLLASLIHRANSYSCRDVAIGCDDPGVAGFLAATLKTNATQITLHEALPPVVVVTRQVVAQTAVESLRSKRGSFIRWLSAGGTCVIALPRAKLPGVTIRPCRGEDVVFADMSGQSVFGWNSGDLDLARVRGVMRLRDRSRYVEHVRAWHHRPDSEYGGLNLDGPAGSVLVERRVGKGRLYITSVDLARIEERPVMVLWQSMLSFLGVRQRVFVKRNETVLVAKRTIPLPLDGDFHKWSNEHPDGNVEPWSRAIPVPIDERHANRFEPVPRLTHRHGAVFYVMHDKQNLYCAAMLVSDAFRFEGVETLRHQRDSIEVRLGNSYLLASVGADGAPYLHATNLRNGSAKRVEARVRLFEKLPACVDLALLKLDASARLRAAFFELKIPLDVLPEEFSTAGEIALAFNARLDGPVERLQCSFPETMKWDDPTTFANLTLQ